MNHRNNVALAVINKFQTLLESRNNNNSFIVCLAAIIYIFLFFFLVNMSFIVELCICLALYFIYLFWPRLRMSGLEEKYKLPWAFMVDLSSTVYTYLCMYVGVSTLLSTVLLRLKCIHTYIRAL